MAATLNRRELSTDILVIGGGAAGAMAGIKAKMAGADVLLVTKGRYPSGNTSIAAWGFAAALGNSDPRDNSQVHFEDGLRAGQGLNNRKLLRAWTTRIVDITKEMDSWGHFPVERDSQGRLKQITMGDFHSYPRMITMGDHTGKAVDECLGYKSKEVGLPVLEFVTVGGILKKNGAVAGVWGIQNQTGDLLFIKAKAIIWATGGVGHFYPITDNVRVVTGEGYALAFRAGVELTSMEFTNFILGVCYPEQMRVMMGPTMTAVGLSNSGETRLYNGVGERFLKAYFKPGEPIGGIKLIQAVGHQIAVGKATPHGGVYLDCSDVTPEHRETISSLWQAAKRAGVDLDYQPIEIAPEAHDETGGIKIDETASTCVPGLYAAGEAAGGTWGAGRFAGGAVADALSFGEIASQSAIAYAKKLKGEPSFDKQEVADVQNRIESLLSEKKNAIEPRELKEKKLQSIASRYLSAGRNEEGLKKALQLVDQMERDDLSRLSIRADDVKQRALRLSEAIEVDGQLVLARIIAAASLVRQDSRGGEQGGHYRSDFPFRDDENWMKTVTLKREKDGSISTYTEPPVME